MASFIENQLSSDEIKKLFKYPMNTLTPMLNDIIRKNNFKKVGINKWLSIMIKIVNTDVIFHSISIDDLLLNCELYCDLIEVNNNIFIGDISGSYMFNYKGKDKEKYNNLPVIYQQRYNIFKNNRVRYPEDIIKYTFHKFDNSKCNIDEKLPIIILPLTLTKNNLEQFNEYIISKKRLSIFDVAFKFPPLISK